MEFVLSQLYNFGMMFIFGVFLGLTFHIYRNLVKKIRRKKQAVINITDLLLGLFTGVTGFITLLMVNWGQFRFYIILAIISGMSVYFYTIKKIKILLK